MNLKGKVVIITGAGSGIGQATAETLNEAGMKCLLTARSEEKIKKVAEALNDGAVVAGDMTAPSMPEKLVDAAIKAFGRLDAVFNNAGVMRIGSIDDADIDGFCQMVRLNFEAVVRMSYTVLRHFKKQGSGFLINMSSLSGLKTFPKVGVYNGTKHAVEAFTDSLRMELAGTGIKVSAIEPGRTRTHLFDHWRDDQKFDPAEGLLEAEDIARCVRFILEQPDEVLIPRMLVMPARQPG